LMHTRSDIARATLEGIALNLRVALDVLKKYVTVGENMLIVGGGSKSPLWRQIFADVYEMNIATARVGQDAGSFGAAAVAAVGAGVWTDFEKIKSIVNDEKLTVPSEELSSFYNSLIPSFRKLLDISSDVGDLLKNI